MKVYKTVCESDVRRGAMACQRSPSPSRPGPWASSARGLPRFPKMEEAEGPDGGQVSCHLSEGPREKASGSAELRRGPELEGPWQPGVHTSFCWPW